MEYLNKQAVCSLLWKPDSKYDCKQNDFKRLSD